MTGSLSSAVDSRLSHGKSGSRLHAVQGTNSALAAKPVAIFYDAGIVWIMAWVLAQIDASDGFALAMLGVIALAMGTVALLFYCMKRCAARRDPHVDALLEELENEEREAESRTHPKPTAPQAPAWERDADWWKNG